MMAGSNLLYVFLHGRAIIADYIAAAPISKGIVESRRCQRSHGPAAELDRSGREHDHAQVAGGRLW